MADVGSLVDCLEGIHGGLASMAILDLYDEKRRQKYYTVTDPVSTVNLKRLFLPGEDALMLDRGLQKMAETARDPVAAKALFEVWKHVDMHRLWRQFVLTFVTVIGSGQSHRRHVAIL